jgi:hypothetical protein
MRPTPAAAVALGLAALLAAGGPDLLRAAAPGQATARQPGPARPRQPVRDAPRSRAPARREVAVPFRVGESLTYNVSWSQYLIAGTATSTVVAKEPSSNSAAYTIVAEGRPLPILARLYQLYYRMNSSLDSFTLLTHRSSLYSEEGSRRRQSATRFDRTARRAFFEITTDPTTRTDFAMPPHAQDGLATLYALRARTFSPGERVTVPVVDEGMLYAVDVEAAAVERVKVAAGEFDATSLKVSIADPANQPVGRDIVVWYSTDARRLPVKIQAGLPVGDFVLALRDIK